MNGNGFEQKQNRYAISRTISQFQIRMSSHSTRYCDMNAWTSQLRCSRYRDILTRFVSLPYAISCNFQNHVECDIAPRHRGLSPCITMGRYRIVWCPPDIALVQQSRWQSSLLIPQKRLLESTPRSPLDPLHALHSKHPYGSSKIIMEQASF